MSILQLTLEIILTLCAVQPIQPKLVQQSASATEILTFKNYFNQSKIAHCFFNWLKKFKKDEIFVALADCHAKLRMIQS